VVAGTVILIPVYSQGYLLRFLTLTWIFGISVLGLRFLHLVGEVNFGHIGFVAIGAYVSALLAVKAGVPFLVSLVGGCVIPGLLGLGLGFISMKLTGAYFFMVTFAVNEVIILSLTRLRFVTGGYGGISNIPAPAQVFVGSDLPYYYAATGFLIVVFTVTEVLDKSYFGTVLKSIAQAPSLAESVGINTLKSKAYCLSMSCSIAGLSGSLFAHYVGFINPDCFSFHYMMDTLTFMIVGGAASGVGSILGTLLVRSIIEAVGGLQQYELILSSGLLLVVMLFLREGIISLPQMASRLLTRK
jgi:branched-chain amino acid transport system permease protein